MNSTRYKTLLSYLPGMASVVNSFQSEQVQLAVFDRLMAALEEKTEVLDATGSSRSGTEADSSSANAATPPVTDIVHELVEGDSIHAELEN